MILSERELELGDDHAGIIVLPEPCEPGTPLGDVLPLGEEVLEIEVTRQPARPASRSTASRARWRRSSSGELRRCRARPRAGRRRAGRHRDRGLRGLPALHRPAVPRREDRRRRRRGCKARLSRCRDAPDLERRRRDELRHARARQPAARLRHDTLAGGRIVVRRARAGEEFTTPRRRPPQARPDRPRHRRRRARRSRSPGSWAALETEVGRDDDLRPARGRELRAGHDPRTLRAPRAPHRGLEPLGEGRRPAPRRARRAGSRRSSSSSSPAPLDGRMQTSSASCPSRR